KLSTAAAAGDQNAREWGLDLKEIALAIRDEQSTTTGLLQAIHARCLSLQALRRRRRILSSQKVRLAGQHDYLQPNSHTRHADAIELIAGHARPDERTRLSRGSRRSSDGAQSSWSADQNALGSAWIAAGTGCW
ncbi:MAG TPA: hypothetical protein VN959_12195, partial [Mycobacterium sp.]|nr:hypothetical protein [Mycobacterium sp.]